MKNLIPLTAIAALVASGISSAQDPTPAYSKPSGYETTPLAVGFNLVGMRLLDSSVVSGTFTSNTSTTLVDSNAAFSLDATTLYLVEFGGTGSVGGMILEAQGSSFSGNTLSGLSGITASHLTSYTIRPAKTIGQVFGTGADVLLDKGTAASADTIFLPNASGGFDTFYHSADITSGNVVIVAGGWRRVGGGSTDQASNPINYLDAFYVQIKSVSKSLVVTGQVKTSSTLLPAVQGFSYLSSIYPAGTTLGSSGLATSILKGTAASADLILLPNELGGFDSFYHSADITSGEIVIVPGGWRQVSGGSADKSTQPFASGFILQRRGESADLPFSPPSYYSDL